MAKSHFPILTLIDGNYVVFDDPEQIPHGVSFRVLKTNYTTEGEEL